MEEKEKPSRETNKKGRCHEIQEKKTVFRVEESTMSNATEKLKRMKRPRFIVLRMQQLREQR